MGRLILDKHGKVVNIGGVIDADKFDILPKLLTDSFTENDYIEYNNIDSIKAYLFQNCKSLQNFPKFNGLTTIGNYAFYGCTNLKRFTIPNTVTKIGNYAFHSINQISGELAYADRIAIPEIDGLNIGDYAFYELGIHYNDTLNRGMVLKFLNATIGASAFEKVCIKDLSGTIKSISSGGFKGEGNFRNLGNIDLVITSGIGTSAFERRSYFGTCKIKFTGSYIYSKAFCFFGVRGHTGRALLDFSESTITNIPQYCFEGWSMSDYKNSNFDIYLPRTCASFDSYAFRYTRNFNIFIDRATPPTISSSNTWTSAVGHKIFVPYNSIGAYKTATNWTTWASSIYGWIHKATSTVLPEYDDTGYALTWYSDIDRQHPVSEAEIGSDYYCVRASSASMEKVTSIKCLDCSITLTDGTNVYTEGDFIPIGTTVDVQVSPNRQGDTIYQATLNGSDISSNLSFTASANNKGINIFISVYDGVNNPYELTGFANNTWEQIRRVADYRIAEEIGWTLGDTKTFEGNDGNTYTVRLVDFTEGRYYDADTNKYTYITFDCIETGAQSKYYFEKESGDKYHPLYGRTYNNSELKTYIDTTVYDNLSTDLKNVLHNTKIKYYNREYQYDKTTSDAIVKIFIPSNAEITTSTTYKEETVGYKTVDPLGALKYWSTHTTDANRKKCQVGTTTGRRYFERTLNTDGESGGFLIGDQGTSYSFTMQQGEVAYVSFMFAM